MAFNGDYLSPIGPVSNDKPNLWSYKTADAAATVDTAAYFPVGYGLKLGDVIMRITVDSVTLPTSVSASGFHVVVNVSATAVDVADALAFTATDTD